MTLPNRPSFRVASVECCATCNRVFRRYESWCCAEGPVARMGFEVVEPLTVCDDYKARDV